MAAPRPSQAIRRLLKDQQELTQCPIPNISATPLENDFFEWHCNIRQDKDTIQHVILFFPADYPYTSPSAEFVPSVSNYNAGAVKPGKKGSQICLSIFSDFAENHREWATEKATGWSPGYTAQTILLNLVSFLAEINSNARKSDKGISDNFVCQDCGHCKTTPFPALTDHAAEESIIQIAECSPTDDSRLDITDYISKEVFDPVNITSDSPLFGYGLVLTKKGRKSYLTTPCEYLSSETFYNMQRSSGKIYSVMREEISFFLPLHINKLHGYYIKKEFEKMLRDVRPVLFQNNEKRRVSYEETILELIPNLMCSTVVEFSKGSQHTSDNHLQGYFALHRLFLWAKQRYQDLGSMIESRIESFISDPNNRNKTSCPDLGQWLMLLSVSDRFRWFDASEAYLSESFRRNVMWYQKDDDKLRDLNTDINYRLEKTFQLTAVSRNLLAFQVAFLKIAKPKDFTLDQIIGRYDQNFGMADSTMVDAMKTACQTITTKIAHYGNWYSALGLNVRGKSDLFEMLKSSVSFANSTKGYFFDQRPNGARQGAGTGRRY